MKKYLAILLFTLITISVSAEGITTIFDKYKSIDGVETFHIGPLTSFLVNLKTDKDDDSFSLTSLSVITLDKSKVTGKDFENFNNEIKKMIKKEKLEILLKMNEDDSSVTIFAKTKNEIINEMIVFTQNDNETSLIGLKGKIKLSEVNKSFVDNLPLN